MKTKMNRYCLFKTITHPKLEKPSESTKVFEAPSLSAVIKHLKISGKEACDLRLYGKTTWTDKSGGTHTLELRQEN